MHVLIIPSEFYDDKNVPLAGIFQKDQATLIAKNGNTVGVLAVKPKFTLKELIYSTVKRKIGYLNYDSTLTCWFHYLLSYFFINSRLRIYQKEKIRIAKYLGSYKFFTGNQMAKLDFWKTLSEKSLNSYIQKFGKPDVLHTHNIEFAGMVGIFLSRNYKIPLVHTEHSCTHKFGTYKEHESQAIANAFNKINHKFAVSPSLAELIESKYELKNGSVGWHANVIDKDFQEVTADKKEDNNRNIMILSIGSLISIKRHDFLIEAFTRSFKNDSNIFLNIIGDGVLMEPLKDKINSLKMSGKIKLCGLMDRKMIKKELRRCDFLVHPSDYETFGVVLIEALALGKPVVATKCGGPECIVNSSNGILVERDSINSLSSGLEAMSKSFDSYNAQQIKNDLINQFGSNSFLKKTKEIYQTAINDYNN